jgi:photosystem II stability/assembly factor-like uncharacterized protein
VGRVPTQKTITALVSDLSNPQILYASSGDGVFKSENAGDTWQTVNTGLSETRVAAVALHPTQPSRIYALTASGGVFRSTDGAATWQRQGQLPQE